MGKYDKELEEIYFNIEDSGGYCGVDRLYKRAIENNPSITRSDVREWLTANDTYTLFKPVKRRFKRLPILVDRIDEQWQADLMDVSWWKRYNDGITFILVVVDVLSRYAWIEPLKDKSAQSVTLAFSRILDQGRIPAKLQTDQEKEFLNRPFKNLMESNNINHFTTTNDEIKCAIVERLNRSLRERIYRYLHANKTTRYLDILDKVVKAYNSAYHRTIKMAPQDVNEDNAPRVLVNIRKTHKIPSRKPRKGFNEGDFVKIPRKKDRFEKGATSNWTEEIFKIAKSKKTPLKYIYKLVDYDGEPITSIFYPEELNKVKDTNVYKVEKVLKTRLNPRTKKREYFVKWLGYPSKFNSWVTDLQ